MTTAIKVENLSKEYRLGVIGHETLKKGLQIWMARIRSKRDSKKRINAIVDTTKSQVEGNIFWALRGLNFEVQKGDVLGIIGKNGAGKSTLLKIITRITAPTNGKIQIKGSIASLLEVGTGFHPELTGRENIFLNGAILGMTKREISCKIDEIIKFSGVEHHIDTPVKRYSSGMYVRLAFAVAGHLEPDILIVDEVLAVGDVAFQKKCIGKMASISKEGRTIIFVSHNLGAIRSLCPITLLLSKGEIKYIGPTEKAIQIYLSESSVEGLEKDQRGHIEWSDDVAPGGQKMRFSAVRLFQNLDIEEQVTFDAKLPIMIEIRFNTFQKLRGIRIAITLQTQEGVTAFVSSNEHNQKGKQILEEGIHTIHCKIPPRLLNMGTYILKIGADIPNVEILVEPVDILSFEIALPGNHGRMGRKMKWPGVVAPTLNWSKAESIIE